MGEKEQATGGDAGARGAYVGMGGAEGETARGYIKMPDIRREHSQGDQGAGGAAGLAVSDEGASGDKPKPKK